MFDKSNKKNSYNNTSPFSKIYHFPSKRERPIPEVYPMIDTDLARDNLENDITDADLQDLQ